MEIYTTPRYSPMDYQFRIDSTDTYESTLDSSKNPGLDLNPPDRTKLEIMGNIARYGIDIIKPFFQPVEPPFYYPTKLDDEPFPECGFLKKWCNWDGDDSDFKPSPLLTKPAENTAAIYPMYPDAFDLQPKRGLLENLKSIGTELKQLAIIPRATSSKEEILFINLLLLTHSPYLDGELPMDVSKIIFSMGCAAIKEDKGGGYGNSISKMLGW
jgi:hypothetical protein